MLPLGPLSGVLADIKMFLEQPQSPVAKIVLGVKAISLGLVAQLLMVSLELAIELSPFPFPASMLAMCLLFTFLCMLGYVWGGFENFYISHLRQPVSLSNTQPPVSTTYLLSRIMTDSANKGELGQPTYVHRLLDPDSYARSFSSCVG